MSKKLNTEEFIKRSREIHGDKYDYSETVYRHNTKKVRILCPIHGAFYQYPRDHYCGHGCSYCAGNNISDINTFLIEARKIHGDRYDYTKAVYRGSKAKLSIICSTHGEFLQSPQNHINLKHGCPKCGGTNRSSTEDFIEKAKKIHGHRYDYSIAKYHRSSTKISIICYIHGVFNQTPTSHLSGNGCPKCAIIDRSRNNALEQETFIQKAKIIHGDQYDYSKALYKTTHIPLIIICKKHGEFIQKPNVHLSGCGCPKCNESHGERTIRSFLIKNNIGFESQYSFKDCRYRRPLLFDFYLPNFNIAIEFQGIQHKEPIGIKGIKNFELIKVRDNIKREYCKNNSICLEEIWYYEDIEYRMKQILKSLHQ